MKHLQAVLRVDNMELVVNEPYSIRLINDRGEETILKYDSNKTEEKQEDYNWIIHNIKKVVDYGI
jgi:hypothetical protein